MRDLFCGCCPIPCCCVRNKDRKERYFALAVLTAINALNFIDRVIPASTKSLYQPDLNLSNFQTSIPVTTFLIVYMIAGPIFGTLVDRGFNRKLLLSIGIVTWSIATASSYFAIGFWTFLLSRTSVGIGEACYATIAPVFIGDLFPPAKRSKALAIFYSAMPVGGAIGYMIGSQLGHYVGWRYTFLFCGFPGILIAFIIFRVKDPGRGVYDNEADRVLVPWKEAIPKLLRNRLYLFIACGVICTTFGIGGVTDWLPTFLEVEHRVSAQNSGVVVGIATVIGGLVGGSLGLFMAEKLLGKIKHPYLVVCSISTTISGLMMLTVLLIPNFYVLASGLVVAQIFLWCSMGPINSLSINCVPANIRARAFSLQIFASHALGDAISPPIIGELADVYGNLLYPLFLIPIAIVLGGIIWGIACRATDDVVFDLDASLITSDITDDITPLLTTSRRVEEDDIDEEDDDG